MESVMFRPRYVILAILFSAATFVANCQISILDSINNSGTTVKAIVPDKLAERLFAPKTITEVKLPDTPAASETLGVTVKPTTSTSTVKTVGFRIQVYSDNNQRTARAEAEKRAGAVRAHFPDYQVYVVFQSPYWRVKVGDFRTRSQAEEAVERMRSVLPAYGKEMRVVKDHITVTE